ncbi:2TM domain-containing protein [Formosa sediminum]|uniref:2TM domain-containing protein n=1 Tax=Formosa sediminum TaxID=2594004 RepID=A0A516GS53_9FLAO|nr:2TM domain-containing protein [Formosa sediminum]QDO94345.1 2TM domain-containing protein [Formosa sediminum]
MENSYFEQERYERAKKQVRRVSGFYRHALVYAVINIIIAIVNTQHLEAGESYFQWQNFTTLFFWGIGLVAHGASVFLPTLVIGKNWEDEKIKELMEKEKNHKWE